jgi:hypothetical protein
VAELEGRADDFETAGLRLAVIGNGEASHIPGFRKATGFTGEVYTDPDKEIYKSLDFRRGMGSMVGLKSVKSLMGSVLSGHFSPGVQGDALQQGGVLIAGPGETAGLAIRNREAGDYPGVEELLAAAGAEASGADGGEESG